MAQVGRFLKGVLKGGLITTGLGITGGVGYAYATDPRSLQLWTGLGPVIVHYRAIEFKQKHFGPASTTPEAEAEWNTLHEKYADHVLKSFQDLRGFYTKVGQYMASRNDVIPEIYSEKLRTLEDQVPHNTTRETILRVLKESLGVGELKDVFVGLDLEKPVGTASIGQVFRARLKENGADVAIKVQTPGVETLFRGDLKTARAFAAVMAPEQLIIFDEIERQFLTEFDYRREADQLEQVHQNMKKYRKEVVVPRPYKKYCTKEVLVMDFIPGPKLIEGIREMGRRWAAQKGVDFEQLQRDTKAKYEREGLPPPYDGPTASTLQLYRFWLRFWDLIRNYPVWLYNTVLQPVTHAFTLGLVSLPKAPYFHIFIPLNTAKIMDTLIRVHGHQLLVDGFFNADPHTGNFLLCPDERIGLIDYGQVKRLTKEQRLDMVKLVAALYRDDLGRIQEIVIRNGYVSKHYDPVVMRKMVTVCFDQDGRNVTDGLNLQQFMDKMYEMDPWEKTGELVIMPARLSFLLRGIGLMMNHPVSLLRVWGPLAEKVLKAEKVDYNSLEDHIAPPGSSCVQIVKIEDEA
ncbi:hypothetical protein R1sor_013598 [Riccia sorocarpa]|uniref:ABC1 atypical kinase-like domain-containing protein n=1 Tax=Riccia sorocarpa TaxID=122646 RepID=A0ABD3HD71_9MARC